MCRFFSFVTDPENHAGRRFYFNKNQRKVQEFPDSHSVICREYGLDEDACNKYEYDPDEQEFTVDTINSPVDDRFQAEDWVRKLDFSKIENANVWGLKVGDEVGFLTSRVLHKKDRSGKIRCGWNEKMDYLCSDKDNVKLVLTKGIIRNLVSQEKVVAEIYDEKVGYSWLISADMLKLPKKLKA